MSQVYCKTCFFQPMWSGSTRRSSIESPSWRSTKRSWLLSSIPSWSRGTWNCGSRTWSMTERRKRSNGCKFVTANKSHDSCCGGSLWEASGCRDAIKWVSCCQGWRVREQRAVGCDVGWGDGDIEAWCNNCIAPILFGQFGAHSGGQDKE